VMWMPSSSCKGSAGHIKGKTGHNTVIERLEFVMERPGLSYSSYKNLIESVKELSGQQSLGINFRHCQLEA